MQYQLREGLSFCFVDGHPVFLDIRKDRYFMLPAALEPAFADYIHDQESYNAALCGLLESTEPVGAGPSQTSRPARTTEPASRSVLEEQTADESLSARAYLEVAFIVCKSKIRLRKVGLEGVLKDLATHRRRMTVLTEEDVHGSTEANIIAATKQFVRARRLVPIGTTCLLDSLSLATYLANRHLLAKLVFGVTFSPFSAHCWVQFRDIALNETVTEAAAHTQILVW